MTVNAGLGAETLSPYATTDVLLPKLPAQASF